MTAGRPVLYGHMKMIGGHLVYLESETRPDAFENRAKSPMPGSPAARRIWDDIGELDGGPDSAEPEQECAPKDKQRNVPRHCRNGHALTPNNVLLRPDYGFRCLACRRDNERGKNKETV